MEEANGTSETVATAAAKKKKPNSPKAPGLPLRGAVGEVARVYERYSHAAFTRGEMASALSMSSGSGAFYGKAATLNMYGLVEEVGGSIKVSSLFKSIYQSADGSPELRRNAYQAIGRPVVFANLLRSFGSRIPDEAAIALRLEMSSGFNRDRAQEVAAAFRSSLSDYGLIDGSGNLLPVRDEPGVPLARDEDDDDGSEAPAPTIRTRSVPTGPDVFRIEVPLANGRKAVVALPEDMSDADAKKICAILNAYATA